MKPFNNQKVTLTQKKMLENLIKYRTTTIKETQIPLKKYELLLLNFVNSLGENGYKKAIKLSKTLSKRGKSLKKMTEKSNTNSDMFYNVYPRVTIIEQYYSFTQTEFSAMLVDAITNRTKELNQLKKMNFSQKQKYIQLLEKEIKEAKKNYIKFRINNFVS